MSVRLGIDPFSVPRLEPTEFISLAAAVGFRAVGLRTIQPAIGSHPGPALVDANNLDAVTAALESTGTSVFSVDIIDLVREADFGAIADGLLVAQQLGAGSVNIIAKSEDRSSVLEGLEKLCELALPLGISPRLEPISYLPINTFAEVADLVSRFPGAGVLVDTLHFHRIGGDLDEIAELIRTLPVTLQINGCRDLPDLFAVRRDQNETDLETLRWESVYGRLLPTDGVNRVSELIALMPDDAVVMLEAPNATRVQEIGEIEYLRLAYDSATSVVGEPSGHPSH